MSQIHPILHFLIGLSKPKTYIETGTYKGTNIQKILESGRYSDVVSIELSDYWFEHNCQRFKSFENFHPYQGDSGIVLDQIWDAYDSPKVVFLDAHHSGPGTALGSSQSPLIQELTALKSKNISSSIIIIDDIRFLGKAETAQGDQRDYFDFEIDWRDITLEKIIELLPRTFMTITNSRYWMTDGPADQLLCFPVTKWRKILILAIDKYFYALFSTR